MVVWCCRQGLNIVDGSVGCERGVAYGRWQALAADGDSGRDCCFTYFTTAVLFCSMDLDTAEGGTIG